MLDKINNIVYTSIYKGDYTMTTTETTETTETPDMAIRMLQIVVDNLFKNNIELELRVQELEYMVGLLKTKMITEQLDGGYFG